MAGSAMLAIAVSSEAIASAVKIAAIAQRRCSGGKPSCGLAPAGFAVIVSTDMLISWARGRFGRTLGNGVYYGRTAFHSRSPA